MNSSTYRMAAIADHPVLLKLVKEFHELEHLPFDEQADSTALENIDNSTNSLTCRNAYDRSTLYGSTETE